MTRWLRHPLVWIPITLALLGLVVWRARPWEAGARLGAVEPIPLVLAVALNGVIAVLWAVRSADLLGAAGRPVGVVALVPMTALANTVNNLTPGSVGELLRLYLLRERHAVDYRTGAAVILIERLVAFGYITGSAAIAWLGQLAGLPDPVVIAGFAILAVLPALPYRLGLRPSAVVVRLPLGPVVGRSRWDRAAGTLERIDRTIGRLLTDPVRLTVFAATTGLVIAAYAAQLWLVGAAVGSTLGPIVAWGALGLSITVGVVSFLPFGLGATDLVLAALLESVGVPPVEAVAIVFGYRLVATVPLALAGAASYALVSATLPAGGARDAMRAASAGLEAGLPEAER